MHENAVRDGQRARYDQLWSESIGGIRSGKVALDPVLKARVQDQRRGLTLIARPSPAVQKRVVVFLRELRRLEPAQHYYAPSEFHLTILSLFTATVNHRPFFAQTENYISAVDSALREVPPIRIEFKGTTVSPATVMIQGFFENHSLNNLRDVLRSQLRRRGLAEGVDQRYRLESAHMTIARFCVPLRESDRFAATLELARVRSFGMTTIKSLSLVENDWYMSRHVTKTVKRYRLTRKA